MTVDRGPGESPVPLTPRARHTIVFFVAQCRDCEFKTEKPMEATSHCIVERHTVDEAKRYRLEPPK